MKRLLFTLVFVAFAAAPALADPKSDVVAAVLKFTTATSFHMTATAMGRTLDADFVPPDKMHLIAGPLELIKIGQTTWFNSGNTWRQFAMPGMDQLTGVFTNAIGTVRNTSPDDVVVTDLGLKSPAGIRLHAYAVTNKAGTTTATLYLDGNGTLVRVEGPGGSTVTFSKFNAPIDIQPPPQS